MPQSNTAQLLKIPQVTKITGLSRSTIYRLIKDGEFPGPIRITRRRVAWRQDDIQSWFDSIGA
ncbi:helix-turn-helix transcriptional regulator [Alkalimarinus alittae]|uniref:AlpA family transcriptional regulator n=1 Tax=Alkalimarinus alittae TaxID=2961619 RepID=A0ABY6N7D8_9ALTE|nr:AlpA family transcriptional regulator [Alkalimarinus alittae]UZE97907.1 AlpA family transcriptional regulator [Alkalimarinus alittae]